MPLVKHGRGYLQKRLDDPELAAATDTSIAAWLGHAWQLAALRAGIPSVIIPFAADQPFWGRLITRNKLGDLPTTRKRLTANRLAESLSKVLSNIDIRQASLEMGNKIRTEDGVGTAVAAINE